MYPFNHCHRNASWIAVDTVSILSVLAVYQYSSQGKVSKTWIWKARSRFRILVWRKGAEAEFEFYTAADEHAHKWQNEVNRAK